MLRSSAFFGQWVNKPRKGNDDHSGLRCLAGEDKPVLKNKNVQWLALF